MQSTVRSLGVLAAVLVLIMGSVTTGLRAQPTGGQVVAGSATFASEAGMLTITQSSARAIINWQDFSLANGELARFVQPDATSAILNRVISDLPSSLAGTLESNGRVFLINPNGIAIGPGARIDTAGFIASTLDVANQDFLAGGDLHFSGDATAAIQNLGTINALEGDVFLIARQVENVGTITAANGTTGFAAGSEVLLTTGGNERLFISAASTPGAIINAGAITAATAELKAAGGNAYALAINNTGLVRATGTATRGGQLWLVAGNDGTVINNGALMAEGGEIRISGKNILQAGAVDASGVSGGTIALSAKGQILQTADGVLSTDGSNGTGGTVTVDASPEGSVYLSGRLSASGTSGGKIFVQGRKVQLAAAKLDATGVTAGGRIFVGGGFQGTRLGGLPNAQMVNVGPGSVLDVSASGRGPGGAAVVWSESLTNFGGAALARGGPQGGDGGLIEVSSRGTVGFGGHVDASAASGRRGLFLLDPKNLNIEATAPSTALGIFTLPDPTPAANDQHGSSEAVELSSGNIVVVSSNDNFSASGSGAVYLYDGTTRALISTLTGSTAGDAVGSGGITQVGSGNFVVASNDWNNGGTAANAGAVTWGSGTLGVSGAVSAANSLVGSVANDKVGGNITLLTNGNYVVASSNWTNGAAGGAGAATWGSGATGISGVVSAANSLVGSTADDRIGANTLALTNGNYVVGSSSWANRAATQAGAVTWGNGTTGIAGVVSATNSLIGSSAYDAVGRELVKLPNGNYVVNSPYWNNSGGAVTWGNGLGGTVGAVSSTNSLVGKTAANYGGSFQGDTIGGGVAGGQGGVTVLTNGNYVVASPDWNNVTVRSAGAVTWGNGLGGTVGDVSSANSLVGTSPSDNIGAHNGVTALSNGNYVVNSYNWNDGATTGVGAVTWGNGATGTSGAVSATNSLVGSTADDQVGRNGITELTGANAGNYVVASADWSGTLGAVTWGSGTTGVAGVVSAANSLVGSTANDQVGRNVTKLTNGNYVVTSDLWNNGAATSAGAATWGNGATGTAGVVSAGNSLVGATTDDQVGGGGITALTNGNYVVRSASWNNGAATAAGAATWGNGTTGIVGAVTAGNSLVGTTTDDNVGSYGVTALTNGHYVVASGDWNNGAATAAGAATWGNGTTGITGAVSAANSLVGSTANDHVGNNVETLSSGNYVVTSPDWANGPATSAGAATWGNGTTGTSGAVSAANSLVGTTANDRVGFDLTILTNGNYVVISEGWNNGSAVVAGAVTWGNGTAGIVGAVSATNSLVGTTANDQVGSGGVIALTNGTYVVTSTNWNNGAAAAAGAASWSSGATGVTGAVSSANSLVGVTTNDQAGSDGYLQLSNGNLVVRSSGWDNGAVDAGIVHYLTPGSSAADPSAQTYGASPGANTTLSVAQVTGILNTGTNLVLQANNDLTVNATLTINNDGGAGGALTLSAGRSVLLNASITTDNGNLTVIANDLLANGVVDAHRDAGAAVITMATGTTINAGTGNVVFDLRAGTGLTNNTSGALTLGSITAGTITATNQGPSAGDLVLLTGATLTASATGNALTLAAASGGDFLNNSGSTVLSTPAGRWLVYSTSPAGSTENGLTATTGSTLPRLYGMTYAGNSPATIASGNHLIYSTQPTLTVTAGNQSRPYGDTNAAFTSSVTAGFVTDDGVTDTLTTAALTGSADLSSLATATSAVASSPFAITAAAGDLASGAGYAFAFLPAALTITARPVTITATVGQTKIYGSADPAAFVYTTTSLGSGSALNGSLTRTAGETVTGGPYAITQGSVTDANNPNYTLTYIGSTFVVTPATLTYTANSATRLFGEADPILSGTIDDFVNSETQVTATTGTLTFSTTATVSSNVGTYAINGSGLTANNGNYIFTQAAGNATALTINPANLILTGTRIYDGSTIFAGSNLTATGVNGETFTVGGAGATGNLMTKNVQTSQLLASVGGLTLGTSGNGGLAGNYHALATAGSQVSVTPAALTVTADNASKDYGQTTTFAGTEFTATGLQNSETVGSITLTSAGAASTATVAGSPYAITPSAATGGTFSVGNYTLSYVNGALTITALTTPPPVVNAPLTITADNKAKVYGAPLPVFTATFNGFINGDTFASVTGLQFNTTATIGSNIGTYTITPFGATAPSYYTVRYVPGTLTINPALLTITANNITRLFGETTPGFTASYTGFVNGDASDVVSSLAFSTATTGSPVDFTIIPGGATAANYSLIYVNGLLHIVMPVVPVGGEDLPVVVIGGGPVFTPDFAVIEQNGRPVFVSLSGSGDNVVAPDEQLVVTLGEATNPPSFANQSENPSRNGLGGLGGPNFGSFELVASLDRGGRPDATQASEPGLFRESSVNMGGFNVVYHEALDDVRQQDADNTALGSSYREFSDSDNPQVNLVRTKIQRKPGEPSAGPSS